MNLKYLVQMGGINIAGFYSQERAEEYKEKLVRDYPFAVISVYRLTEDKQLMMVPEYPQTR